MREFLVLERMTPWILLLFLFCVGIELGGMMIIVTWKKALYWIVVAPALIVFGSWGGGALVASLSSLVSVPQGILVASGLGYYSLSSVLIATQQGPELAAVALLSNIFRELFVITFAPLLVRCFGRSSVIAFSAACAMDSCLPVIRESAGMQMVYPALLSGGVLTFLVPILVGTLLQVSF